MSWTAERIRMCGSFRGAEICIFIAFLRVKISLKSRRGEIKKERVKSLEVHAHGVKSGEIVCVCVYY